MRKNIYKNSIAKLYLMVKGMNDFAVIRGMMVILMMVVVS